MFAPTIRPTCERCRRPASVCWCADLRAVKITTRVVFLQHPREAKVAIGTARMAHLGLAGSELYEGIDFSEHPTIKGLVNQPGTALLFPGVGAVSPNKLERLPETLIVIDGTWPQARKMMELNSALRTLPRIGFLPRRPGNYRIRREPAEHCVATVEAIVEVLALFEGDETRFAPLLRAFNSMVDQQIASAKARTGPPRRRLKSADPWWASTAVPDLAALWPQLVAIVAESNAHRRGSAIPGSPELVQFAAIRLATGETLQSFIAPRRILANGAAHHLDVPQESLLNGCRIDDFLTNWGRFYRPEDRLIGWGSFGWMLLAQEGWTPDREPIDLRLLAAHCLKKRPGSAESASQAIGADLTAPPRAPGRAGRALKAIAALITKLREEELVGRRLAR